MIVNVTYGTKDRRKYIVKTKTIKELANIVTLWHENKQSK